MICPVEAISAEGPNDRETRLMMIWKKTEKNNHTAMEVRAEVAACRKRTEKRMERFSQNATYTILSTQKERILTNSPAEGGMPMMISPIPMTSRLSANSITLITI